MKTIIITGTNNRYQIKKSTKMLESNKKRKVSSKWNEEMYDLSFQKEAINSIKKMLSLSMSKISTQCVAEEVSEEQSLSPLSPAETILKTEIEKKLSSYLRQDMINKRIVDVDEMNLITLYETIEKLIACDMCCYYCNTSCYILYETVREMTQWTLDRLDNKKNHSSDNVVICCLKCNLNRRDKNSANYLFTRKLVLSKIGSDSTVVY